MAYYELSPGLLYEIDLDKLLDTINVTNGVHTQIRSLNQQLATTFRSIDIAVATPAGETFTLLSRKFSTTATQLDELLGEAVRRMRQLHENYNGAEVTNVELLVQPSELLVQSSEAPPQEGVFARLVRPGDSVMSRLAVPPDGGELGQDGSFVRAAVPPDGGELGQDLTFRRAEVPVPVELRQSEVPVPNELSQSEVPPEGRLFRRLLRPGEVSVDQAE